MLFRKPSCSEIRHRLPRAACVSLMEGDAIARSKVVAKKWLFAYREFI
jgi:hypothetical protein